MRTTRSLLPMALLILGAIGLPSAGAGEGSGSIVGNVKLRSGPTVSYEYHYDHNAFADSVDLPGGLIALTRSGNLIRFDPATCKPTREWFGPSRVTCLSRGGPDSAVIGLEDGRIARLDPTSLAFTVVATLPGKPHWVGTRAGDHRGIVAVVERWKWVDWVNHLAPVGEEPGRKGRPQVWKPYSEVHDLQSGQSCAIEGRASMVHLDRKDRAWLGFSEGEFGGWCRRVDLSAGSARLAPGPSDPDDGKKPFSDNVHGFAELMDGQIWILGGVMHDFGSFEIDRVDGDRSEALIRLQGDFDHPVFGPGPVDSPLERVIEEGEGDSLLAFSKGNLIYRTDPKLKRWDLVHKLEIRNSDEYREDVGETPLGVRAVHSRKGGFLLATAQDGYVLYVRGHESRNPAPDQLEAQLIREIESGPDGAAFREWPGDPVWRLRGGRWTQEPANPPANDEAPGSSQFATPDGMLWAVKNAEGDGGARRILFPNAARGPIVDRPEGAESKGELRRLIDGRWSKVADVPGVVDYTYFPAEYLGDGESLTRGEWLEKRMRRKDQEGPVKWDPRFFTVGDPLRVVNRDGPSLVFYDGENERLFGLSYGPDFQDPRFAAISVVDGDLPLNVYDALPWSRDEILIATRKGLKLCEIATGKHRPAPLPSTDRPVRKLARDGLGRLWLGGEGLWMVDPAARLHDLGEVPMVGRSRVMALAADGQRKDGVILSLGVRGVAFIRAEAESR